jgi:hypothetical protein
MVEGRYAVPVVLAMTALAANAELAVVSIVLVMTRHACCRQLVTIEVPRVARIALDLHVCGP